MGTQTFKHTCRKSICYLIVQDFFQKKSSNFLLPPLCHDGPLKMTDSQNMVKIAAQIASYIKTKITLYALRILSYI